LPLIAPAILASMLLCFAVSVDDFVVTYFNAGPRITFPVFVWNTARIGAPPQVNVIGSVIFIVAVTGMIASVVLQIRRQRSAAAA
jgi:spermidine/putrescine transport system permease protein